ncbi:MAG: hypothetical protein Q8Q25_02260 [bacterium]|nr:hypothetical protein [bacterium]
MSKTYHHNNRHISEKLWMYAIHISNYYRVKGVDIMERMFKFLSVAALVSAVAIDAGTTPVVSYFRARPQGANSARKVAGEVGHTHLYDMEEMYGTFWVAPEFTRTFNSRHHDASNHIAQCLFGDDLFCGDCASFVKIQGSAVATRDPKAWLADNFYLPDEFDGCISFSPRISNFLVDFNLYLGLDQWLCGLYFRLYGPFVHTRWDLNFSESAPTLGTNVMPAGKFSPAEIASADLLQTASAFFQGCAPTSPLSQTVTYIADPTTDPDTTATKTFSIERRGLTCSKFSVSKCGSCFGRRTENGFGELRAELGWNFFQDEDYHFGLNLQAAAPTGTKANSCYLFDAIVGNGRHWELGGGATGHYILWRCEDEEKHLGIYGDLSVRHLFKACQSRCFDLCGKPLSRYMLAALHTETITNGLAGDDVAGEETGETAATHQFALVYEPVANLTTQDVRVSVGAQVDFSAWFNYTCRGYSFDLGYNFWYSSCEKFCASKCPSRLNTETLWTLKGDARAFGFRADDATAAADANLPVALAFSQSDATINAGTNAGKTNPNTNPGVDSPLYASALNEAGANREALTYATGVAIGAVDATNHIQLSIPPTFIKESDINYQGSRGLSHKVFAHFAYTWDRECWVPYLGIGAEAEFGKNDCGSDCGSCGTSSCDTACTTTCSTSTSTCGSSCGSSCSSSSSCGCMYCSVSQWGVWLKAGVSFD